MQEFHRDEVVELGEAFLHGGIVLQAEGGGGRTSPQGAAAAIVQLFAHGDAQSGTWVCP